MTGAESEENTHNSLRKLKPKANKNMTCCCIWWPTGFNAVLCLHKASWRNNSNEPSHFIWAKGPFHLSSIKKLNHTAKCAPCVFQALQAFQNIIWCMALLNFWEEKRKHFFTGDCDYYWIEWGFNSFKTIIYRKKKKKAHPYPRTKSTISWNWFDPSDSVFCHPSVLRFHISPRVAAWSPPSMFCISTIALPLWVPLWVNKNNTSAHAGAFLRPSTQSLPAVIHKFQLFTAWDSILNQLHVKT